MQKNTYLCTPICSFIMMKKISFILLGTLLGACSNSAPTLLGDWQLAGINSNGKVIPLNPCSKQNYFSFQKDSVICHTFFNKEGCQEDVFSLSYTATKDSLKLINKIGRPENSSYLIKGDSLFLKESNKIQGKEFITETIFIRKEK